MKLHEHLLNDFIYLLVKDEIDIIFQRELELRSQLFFARERIQALVKQINREQSVKRRVIIELGGGVNELRDT